METTTAAVITPDLDYVYVVHNPDRNSCKIGRSRQPETRLKAFRTGNESDLKITFKLGMDRAISGEVEALARRIAQRDLKKPRTREWLGRTDPEEAKACVEQAHRTVVGRNR